MTGKKILKTTSILLVIVMLFSLSITLISCNKKNDGPTIENKYEIAAKELKVAIMSAKKSDWSKTLTNEEIAKRKDAGEYLLYERGVDFIISTLKEAGIMPVQIDALTALFKKDEVKNLFKEPSHDTNQKELNKQFLKVLLPLLSDDFTAQDISNIFYQFIFSFSRDVDLIFKDVYNRGYEVYEYTNPKEPNRQLLGVAQISLNIFKYFDGTNIEGSEKKEKLLNDIKMAKPGINALGEFAYNVSFTSIYQNFLVKVGENGALQDITKSEIKQTLISLLQNFKDLKRVLTEEQLVYMNIAFENILSSFSSILLNDGIIASMNNILASVLGQITTAYFTLDLIPTLCDAVLTIENLVNNDENFLTQIYQFVTDKNYDLEINEYIILAKVIKNALNTGTDGTINSIKVKGHELFQKIFDKIDNSKKDLMKIDKQMGVIGLDLISTLYRMQFEDKSDSEINNKREEMLIPALTYSAYKVLKVDYEGAKAGIVVGDNVNALPFESVIKKFGKYSGTLLGTLKIDGLDWPSRKNNESDYDFEVRNRAFLSGILAIVENPMNDNSMHKYLQDWYYSAQTHLCGDIDYFADTKYEFINELSNYNIMQNIEGVKESKDYKEVKTILKKLGILIDVPQQ